MTTPQEILLKRYREGGKQIELRRRFNNENKEEKYAEIKTEQLKLVESFPKEDIDTRTPTQKRLEYDRAYSRKYYAEHKEQKLEYEKEYRAKNRDAINERKKVYRSNKKSVS